MLDTTLQVAFPPPPRDKKIGRPARGRPISHLIEVDFRIVYWFSMVQPEGMPCTPLPQLADEALTKVPVGDTS